MIKIFRNIFASALVLFAAVSCVDDRNNFMVDDSLGFSVATNENLINCFGFEGEYNFSIIKSGKGFDGAVATVETSYSYLEAYNGANGTSYVPFPEEYYTLSGSEFQFAASDVVKDVTVTWDADKVHDLIKANPGIEYAIPLKVSSNDLNVNKGRDVLVINISKAKVDFVKSKYDALAVLAEPRRTTESIKMEINALYPEAVGVNFSIENDLAAAYIAEKGLAGYTTVPEEIAGLITLPENNKAIIPANTKEFTLDLTLDTGVFFEEGSDELPELFEGYILPVRAVSVDSEGIVVGNDLVYVHITSTYVLPLEFTPVWGFYSGAWFTSIGGFGAGDRNVAVDEKYVYVPQSQVGGEYVVYTFSVEDGTVGKLKTPSDVKKGDGFTVCAAKVIKNGVEAVNEGNDFLAVFNMTQGANDFVMYAYVDGVENDPKVVTLMGAVDSEARLGDRVNVIGNLKDGVEIIAKDMKTDVVYSYKFKGEVPSSIEPAKISVSGMPATGWQVGSLYVHPDNRNQAVLTTTEGGYFMNSADGASYSMEGWTGGFNGLGGCTDFHFLTVNDVEYISFVKLEETNGSRNRGRVIVLENKGGEAEFKSTLEKAFDEKAPIAFSTPTQHADDFTVPSSAVAGNSAIGLALYETESSILMAALQQNGGLSLYRLTK